MNPIAVWILFGLGLVFLIVGALLMVYGSVQKKAHANDVAAAGGWDKILEAASHVIAALGKYFGPNVSTRVGFALVLIGLVLIFGPLYIPTHA